MADQIRIEIGFDGGQALSVLVTNGSADEIERAIAAAESRAGAGEGAVTVEAEDGRYTLNVGKILFARRTDREQVVGFGAVGRA
jgi:hypothetical protein